MPEPVFTARDLLTPPHEAPDLFVLRRSSALRSRCDMPTSVLDGPMFALHLIPTTEVSVPLSRTSPMPILFNGDSHETRIVHDGLLATGREYDEGVRGYTHVRRDGTVEAVETRLLGMRVGNSNEQLGMPARGFDEALVESLETFASLVRVHVPDVEFRAYLSALGAGTCWFEANTYRDRMPLLSDHITLPFVTIGSDIASAAEELTNYAWNAAGHEQSPYKQQVAAS